MKFKIVVNKKKFENKKGIETIKFCFFFNFQRGGEGEEKKRGGKRGIYINLYITVPYHIYVYRYIYVKKT